MRRAQKGFVATAFVRRHVRLDCTIAALRAFQEYFLAYYTPGKELFFFPHAFGARDASPHLFSGGKRAKYNYS